MQSNGTSYDHLLRQLDARLGRIEEAIDRLADHHEERHGKLEARLVDLERTRYEATGSYRTLVALGAVIATIGGVVGNLLAKFWPAG